MTRNTELFAALICILALTAVYLLAGAVGPTRPSSLFGHWIGIAGLVLMLMTETLYSLRKQSGSSRWGQMRTWLSFHIFTGIIGPYMVFLHTGFRFAGLAGATMWLTAVVVASGFVGLYIHSAIPRTPDGVEMDAAQLEAAIRRSQARLQQWLAAHPANLSSLAEEMESLPLVTGAGVTALLSRSRIERKYHRRWRRATKRLGEPIRDQVVELGALLHRRRTLRRQVAILLTVRRLMALWHTLHVPLGFALFTLVSLHIVAALFFA